MKSSGEKVRRLRTDQVGSLLRPRALLEARASWRQGHLSEAERVKLEDDAILSVLDAQGATHQDIFVDGEFRRKGFMTGFPDSCEGFVEELSAN
jgi:5-methyltetrahydropteroyltriglutamate--homocysteine methyltransferase